MPTKKLILLDKNNFFTFRHIEDASIDIYMILGKRGDGKTFTSIAKALDAYFTENVPSAYVRRLEESLTARELNQLLAPHTKDNGKNFPSIEKRSEGKYDSFSYRIKEFKPVKKDDNGKIITSGKPMLYTMSLNTWETSKGPDRGEIKYIIFDEFITAKNYLDNEVFYWENVISSLKRDRKDIKIIMLANPLNQFCPYFDYYQIHPEKYKQGDIADFKYNSGLKLRFVWLPEAARGKDVETRAERFFNIHGTKGSITTGAWDINQYRHLAPGIYKKSEILYTVGIIFNRQSYKIEILSLNDGTVIDPLFAFIFPSDSFDRCLCIFTDDIYLQPDTIMYNSFSQAGIIADELLNLFRNNRVFYNSNETGNYIDNWLKSYVSKRGVIKP